MTEFISNSAKQTEKIGYNLGTRLNSGDFVALFGNMGTGKTTFVRGLAEGLGVFDFVSSPTFALVHEYHGKLTLFHFDMYRVNTWDDLYSTAFYDYLTYNGVIVVEWSENIETALPEGYIRVELTCGENADERHIRITEEHKIENSCN
jgi:tRNA threonylcarbamoyladenosine biosynthesis protein TsaE